MNKEENIKDNKAKEAEFKAMTHFDDPYIPPVCDIQSHNFANENIIKMIEEMKCFNCMHADVCFAQKGGVNLQLVDSTGCEHYQSKLPIAKEKQETAKEIL